MYPMNVSNLYKSLLSAVCLVFLVGQSVQAADETATWRPIKDLSVNVGMKDANKDMVSFLEKADSPDNLQFGAGYRLQTEAVGSFRLFGELSYRIRTLEADVPVQNNDFDPAHKATLGFGWEKGAFSGMLQGSVLTQEEFSEMDLVTAIYDIEFSWSTPWLGDISVGAKNVMDKPVETASLDKSDPGIKGRVPYIKYQLDL